MSSIKKFFCEQFFITNVLMKETYSFTKTRIIRHIMNSKASLKQQIFTIGF